jgi:NUMOD4 motif/HNH endonuclease
MTERWLPIPDWEGLYEVSNLGRVRSLPRMTNGGVRGGNILSPSIGTTGYRHLTLTASGRPRDERRVHEIVALAFLGIRPRGQEIRHIDGDKLNNAATNLAYGTHCDNEQDKISQGRHHYARRTHCKQGHEFTTENIYVRRSGARGCRECVRIAGRAYKKRMRSVAAVKLGAPVT